MRHKDIPSSLDAVTINNSRTSAWNSTTQGDRYQYQYDYIIT